MRLPEDASIDSVRSDRRFLVCVERRVSHADTERYGTFSSIEEAEMVAYEHSIHLQPDNDASQLSTASYDHGDSRFEIKFRCDGATIVVSVVPVNTVQS
jgi:hypothetical protein